MERVIPRTDRTPLLKILEGVQNLASDQNKKIVDLCYRILDYEREKIVLGEPSAEEKKNYVDALNYLLKWVDFMAKLPPGADPQMIDRSELEWLAKRLKMSRDSFENPMSTTEADQFLARHFPG